LAAEPALVVLDVREHWERALCALPRSLHAPMQQVPSLVGTLDPETEVIIYCHSGIRSQHAARFLEQQGFKRVGNLSGGIDAWAREVDPTMARY
jgi:rhodanese-related sulfurtransferase